MRRVFFFLAFCAAALPLFAQADINRIAPGAKDKLTVLLNKPAMVRPAVATPLGKNWFRLETDAHVFTDQVSLKQVTAAFLDLDSFTSIFNGKRSKISGKIISREKDETVMDFVAISIVPILNIQLKTPYRASVKTTLNTDTAFGFLINQLSGNSASNNDIKDMYAPRYVEEVTINGKTYVYIRMYTIEDINASILPGAKGTLENNSAPINVETLNMIIAAAKVR